MSGGFFRGTSADQDTRFSNKQAKLMKSQKFAPELDHLVDMSKVKIDTVKPWIAKRVTELLGFEDEVLINFIYGLLDKKEVNGKEVQIQLTGFMEKNTGKFMKELWALLLSAQKNASGIPQQILDATDEELKKKKVEADRITHEIQKRKEKEGREYEQEKLKKMDGEVDVLRATNAAPGPISRHLQPRESGEDKEADERNGPRGKSRVSISPKSGDRSPSSNRSIPSRSISRSLSNSRSYSDEKHKSRSISRSPQSRGFSISPERRYRSQRRWSISPRHRPSPRRPRSPLRRRSPHSRRRSPSHSRRRSPSPIRRKSPPPIRRRSPSPVRRRSPFMRRRSPPPLRRRSPSPPRRRSPSLVRRRSPVFVRRRSPTPSWRRSPSPVRWRSPSPLRRRSPSPVRRRSPLPRSPRYRRRSPVRSPRQRNRSRSPYRSHSPAYQSRRSLSRDHDLRSNGVESRSRDDYASQRIRGKMSPVRNATERDGQARKGLDSVSHQPPITLRSPQRDPSDARIKKPALLHSPGLSQRSSESSPHMEKMSPSEDRSPSESPVRQTKERISHCDSPSPVRQARERVTRHGSPETSGEEEEFSRIREDGDRGNHFSQRRIRRSPIVGNPKNSPMKDFSQEEYSPEIFGARRSTEAQHHPDDIELRKNDREKQSVKASMRAVRPGSPTEHTLPTYGEVEYGPGRPGGETFLLDNVQDGHPSANKHERDVPPSSERLQKSCSREGYKTDEKKHSRSSNVEDGNRGHKTETLQKSMKRVDRKNGIDASDSDSEKNEKYRSDYMEKRKHKRSGRHEMASDDHADDGSEIDERKEAKRRRKEEKRLRKEERRRRREERHRRREDRRAGKLKAKSMDTVTPPSDFEKNQDADDSDSNVDVRKESHPSDIEETESEQKKLEIELRKKALESLKAKKGISQ